MITAAMLLLISDWLVIAGNYGPGGGGGGGGHLQERRLLDKPGRSNWAGGAAAAGLEDSRNDTQAFLRLGRSEVHLQKSPSKDIPHERTREEIDKVPQNDGKSFSSEEANSGAAAIERGERNLSLTPAMLKPLFRVHLDETAEKGNWSQASVSPNKLPSPLQKAAAPPPYMNGRFSGGGGDPGRGVKSDDGYVNDEEPVRSNPSRPTMMNSGQKTGSHPTPLSPHTTQYAPPRHALDPPTINASSSSSSNSSSRGLFVTGVPLLRKGAMCEAFEKRCENGMCVSHIMPCPQKACPVTRPFRCKNKWQCISLFRRCDGGRDCDDGSDETGCASLSYPYSHNRRVVVVATVIVVVLGVSLFCCVLIHVYRTAQLNDPMLNRNRRRSSPADRSPGAGGGPLTHPSAPWRALLRMRALLPPYLGQHLAAGAGTTSTSFQSMSSSVTQPFLSQQHGGRSLHHTGQSETLQSFLSAGSEGGGPPPGASASGDDPDLLVHRSALEALLQGPPPPYEEVVNLGPLGVPGQSQSPSRAGLYQDRGPPPTYESIFCIEV